jgi:hypothetical protein
VTSAPPITGPVGPAGGDAPAGPHTGAVPASNSGAPAPGPAASRILGRVRPVPAARTWLFIAFAAAILSLGLPWDTKLTLTPGMITTGLFSPLGVCGLRYDYAGYAYTDCSNWYNWGYYQMGHFIPNTVFGFRGPARVVIALVAIVVFLGYRLGSSRLLKLAPILAVGGFIATGVTAYSGQLVFLFALAALLIALSKDGLVKLPQRRTLAGLLRR